MLTDLPVLEVPVGAMRPVRLLMPAYRKHHVLGILCTEAMKPSRAPPFVSPACALHSAELTLLGVST